jgi:hypothetical protein
MVASGAPISTGTAWGEDDRAWFEAHPESSHRLRAALPGEWPEGGWDLTVVRQLQPGERVRRPLRVEMLPDAPKDAAPAAAWLDATPEEAAWAFFELCCEAAGTDRVLTKRWCWRGRPSSAPRVGLEPDPLPARLGYGNTLLIRTIPV